jgi:hypothetical protein
MAHDHELQEFLHIRMMVLEVKQQLLNGDLANPKPTRVLAKQDPCAAGHAYDVEGHQGSGIDAARGTGWDCRGAGETAMNYCA